MFLFRPGRTVVTPKAFLLPMFQVLQQETIFIRRAFLLVPPHPFLSKARWVLKLSWLPDPRITHGYNEGEHLTEILGTPIIFCVIYLEPVYSHRSGPISL